MSQAWSCRLGLSDASMREVHIASVVLSGTHLWLAGRARELVNRGGQNIVPAEVEDVILTHPDVAEAAVLGTPDAEMGERVCVVIVPRSGAQLTLEALTDFLKHRGLARFKHPEQLLSVSSMPLNPAATKIDKQALREQLLRR